MARVYKTVCDLCEGGANVSPVVVRRGDSHWELDICDKCHKSRFGDLEKLGRKPTRRKRQGFQVVEPL